MIMKRIEKKFKQLKKTKKKALTVFLTAGYPNLSTTKRLVLEFVKQGVDLIELGVPFSDPLADGPVIQESSQVALKQGVDLNQIFSLVKELRKETDIPLCLMTYYNPIFCLGEANFISRALSSGVDGVIVPDLPPEEGRSFIRAASRKGLDVVLFIAPTTPIKRVKYIASIANGFIYYVSLTGVTGMRKTLSSDLVKNLRMIKRQTNKPICVGFGVSTAQQVREVNKVADGVIVGSAVIKKIKEYKGNPDLVKKVGRFISSLRG